MAFAEWNQEVGTFYKRGYQEKYFPASLNERQISTGIRPRDIGRGVVLPGVLSHPPFPSWQEAFFRTARSRQGRADRRGEANP